MEQMNQIKLRGIVGMVNLSSLGEDRQMAKFTVVTNFAYKDKAGNAVIETTWHNVVAFENKVSGGLCKIAKGSRVEVDGRQTNQKYFSADGEEKYFSEVVASRVSVLDSSAELNCEM